MFAANHITAERRKDSVVNAGATGVFCWQLATYELREQVNATAEFVPHGTDEFEIAGLEKTWSRVLDPPVPMVKRSPVRFECKYYTKLSLPGNPPMGSVDVVIGRVVGVHIDESILTDGKIDVRKTQPIARLGYYEYAAVRGTFEMLIPGDRSLLYGLEGSVKGNQNAAAQPQASFDNTMDQDARDA
jgi:flavin reductase (DIM6/NTAB) family NADH-FMN oxidoreductase RutF